MLKSVSPRTRPLAHDCLPNGSLRAAPEREKIVPPSSLEAAREIVLAGPSGDLQRKRAPVPEPSGSHIAFPQTALGWASSARKGAKPLPAPSPCSQIPLPLTNVIQEERLSLSSIADIYDATFVPRRRRWFVVRSSAPRTLEQAGDRCRDDARA